MKWIGRISAVAFALVAGLPAFAISSSADATHVHVQLVVPAAQLNPGETTSGGLYFKLEPGWHVYWKNPGDAGEPPQIQWTLPEGIKVGSLQFPAPKRLPLGPLMDFGYEDEVLFPFPIDVDKAAARGPVTLHAKVNWLVCRETCIPGKAELAIDRVIPATGNTIAQLTSDQAIFSRLANRLPVQPPANFKAVIQQSATGFQLGITTRQREAAAEFFPADPSIIDNPAPQKVTPTATGLILDLKKDASLTTNLAKLNGVLELSGGRTYEISATPGVIALPPTLSLSKLARAVGLAFLGGLLLNLMPCVFPVLFIKGLALVRSGNEERHKLRAHGFVYAIGIVVSFWALVGVLLGLRAAGSVLGWGFQFQSPIFLSLMAAMLFFLGLSLAGQFEIGLSLTSAGGSLAAKQGYTGSFFTGVLAVIVATPCTAPFMGAAVGYALQQSTAVTFAVFTALALGLAAPYVALTLQPAWTRLLPRPGVWMEVLKQATAVPVFGTAIWLAWVLANAYGAALLAVLLISFLLLAIAGWFLGRWPAKRWATVLAGLIVCCVVALSVFSARVLVAPRFSSSHVFSINLPKIPGAAWEPWTEEATARYQAQGLTVFVDFTASWCLSCQVNERVALDQPEVRRAFLEHRVVLLRADWTQHDDAITQTLSALGRSGVPTYALYVPGEASPRLLPEVLTPGIVTDALANLPKTAH